MGALGKMTLCYILCSLDVDEVASDHLLIVTDPLYRNIEGPSYAFSH